MLIRKKGVRFLSVALLMAAAGGAAYGQETIEKQPKIVLLFDVSASMGAIDGPAKPGVDPAKLPSRQDHVLKLLHGGKFVEQLLKKAPVTAYRFGATLDDGNVAQFRAGETWTAEQWTSWLAPSRAGTNAAGAAWQMLQREKDSYLQAIVIFSDGRSNRTTRAQIDACLAAVRDLQPMAPVYTVGVGGFDALPQIKIGDLHAPQEVRPGDGFPVRVPIHGNGLAGADFQVVLQAQRVADGAGQPVAREKRYLPGPQAGTFNGDKAEHFATFDIDLKSLKKNAKESEIEGTWEFTARVPSNPREAFAGTEHVSEPVRVVVQNRRLRVLLFCGGATREYQFLRSILYREMAEKRAEFCTFNQSAGKDDPIDDDIEPNRQLNAFPDRLGPNDAGKRFQSLSDFDVIVAFDADWAKLKVKQRDLLRDWVGNHAGGVIFVAGPVHSYRIARPGGEDFGSLQAIYPVVLKDSRLHGLGLANHPHDPTRPYTLNFTASAKRFPFLKLDPAGESPTAGWNRFFWNNENVKPEPGTDQRPKRGFYTYYPVERIKPNSLTIATFAGPKESRIGDKTDAFKDQQPFLVEMAVGSGKSLYLGSGELWRLRVHEGFHERIWLGLFRHVASDAVTQKLHGQILMPRSAPIGSIRIEAQIQAKNVKPMARLRKLPDDGGKLKSFALDPVPEKAGWFADTIKIIEPGEYSVRISVGEDFVSHRLTVRKEAGELEDVRVDFGQLYQLASKAEPVLAKLSAEARKEIEARLRASAKFPGAPESQDVPWLFFRLADAGAIPACLEKLPPKKFKKVEQPKAPPEPDSEFKKEFAKKKPAVKVLVIDGDPDGVKEAGDTYCIERAITAISKTPYKVVLGHELARADPAKALERDDLATFGAILLLNVRELNAKQLANLEKYSQAGGGVAFFMGPNVNSAYYNKQLYKQGKGIFPVPLEKTYFPPAKEPELEDEELLLRDDLFPELGRYPIFGEIFDDPRQLAVLKHLPIRRYFKAPRAEWRPKAGKSFELATLPNRQPATAFQNVVLDLVRGESLKKLQKDDAFKNYRRDLERHRTAIEDLVRPGTENKAAHLARAIDAMFRDKSLKELWKAPDANVRAVLEDLIRLRQAALHGDPLIVAGTFGKGKVVAVLTSAGKQWTDFPGGCLASVIYQPFIWETLNYLTEPEPPEPPKLNRVPGNARPPRLIGVDLANEPRVLTKNPMKRIADAEAIPQEFAKACLVTADAAIPFRGLLADDAGLAKAHWIVEVHPVEIKGLQFSKILAAQKTLHIPLEGLRAAQERRAYGELIHNITVGSTDKTYPSGIATTHALADEWAFDFSRHLAWLKAKPGELQDSFLVKISLSATSADPKLGTSRTEKPFEFLIVSENELLVHVLRQSEKVFEQLEKAQEKVKAIQSRLDEQIDRLAQPDVDPKLVAPRVAEMRRSLQDSANLVESAGRDTDRMVRDLAMNRVENRIKEKTAQFAEALEFPGFRKAEKSLSLLHESLENGKKDMLLKQAGSVRDDLRMLDKSLTASMDKLSEGMVEAQLITILLAIEKEQRNSKKP